ncbi:putative kinetochore protein spc24 [Yamadazyma tenuis]
MLQGNPEELIQASIESFEIQPDLQTLDRIDENIVKILNKRAALLKQYGDTNGDLQEQISKLQIDVQELVRTNNYPQIHDGASPVDTDVFTYISSKLDELKNLKVSISKNLSDLNVLISSNNRSKLKLTDSLTTLNDNYHSLINKNLGSHKNSNVMKINLYKSLGLVIESKGEEDNILVYNEKEGTSGFLKVDEQYSDYFIGNYIWDKL